MKKGLLSFIAAFVAVFSVSAQDGYWQKDYPWDASGYTAWTAVADTFQTSVWMDSLIVVETSLGGLTNFDNDIIAETGWEADGTRYAVTGSGDVASIAFSPSKSEWSNFQVAFYKWVTGPAPSATTVLMSDHRIGGYLVDMQPSADGIANGVISGEINIPSALNSTDIYAAGSPAEGKFLLRMSIVDAHGHEWNAGGDPIDTLDVYDAWTPFSFDYNTFISEKVGNVEANPGDGWGGKFNDMDRPIAGSDGERAPLDLTMVRAIRFYFNPGVKVAGTTLDANTVQMRGITVGSGTEVTFADAWPSGQGVSVGDVTAEGAVVVEEYYINVLGQVVVEPAAGDFLVKVLDNGAKEVSILVAE